MLCITYYYHVLSVVVQLETGTVANLYKHYRCINSNVSKLYRRNKTHV
jgi:hypothetical protein